MRVNVLTLVGGAVLVAALLVPSLVLAGGSSRLKADMTGEQVVPAGTGAPEGEGHAKVNVRPNKHKLCFRLTYKKIGSTKGLNAAIYEGKRGQNGDLAIKLFAGQEPSPVHDCVKGSKSELKHIKQHPRQHNLDVKTAKYNQGGAIRGQLKPRS